MKLGTEFGQFYRSGGTTWGLKGYVSIGDIPGIGSTIEWVMDKLGAPTRWGFYVDVDGKFALGNVDSYRQISPPTVNQARDLRAAMDAGDITLTALGAEEWPLLADYHFAADESIYVDFTVPFTTGVMVLMARTGDAPVMTLIQPNGVEITPNSLPENVGYNSFNVTNVYTDDTGLPYNQVDTNVVYLAGTAMPGTWQVKLTGVTDDSVYLVDVLGIVEAPALSGLSLTGGSTLPPQQSAEINWRLRSDVPTTTLTLHLNGGPITATLPVTDDQGTPYLTSQTSFGGVPVAEVANPVLDGSLQSTTINLAGLESGEYRVWLDADDGRNPPVRAYVPGVIVVENPWQDSWAANLQVTPGYRQLALHWDEHPNPDVDSYRLYLNTEPILPTAGRLIEVGPFLTTTLESLSPNQPYYLTLQAVDEDTGRTATVDTVVASPLGASFQAAASDTDITLNSGDSRLLTVTLSTALPIYPGPVGLYPVDLPDGVSLQVTPSQITPTLVGSEASLTLSTTADLPGGSTTAALLAIGDGQTIRLPLTITARQPGFTLNAASAVTLTTGGAISLTVNTAAVNGSSTPIDLALANAPDGLNYTFTPRSVDPGQSATLHLTDTRLLAAGAYSLTLSGSDGRIVDQTALQLIADKPGFSLSAAPLSRLALPGEAVTYTLSLSGYRWSQPVQVTLDPDSLSAVDTGISVGFRAAPGDALTDTLAVTLPAQLFVVGQVATTTLPGQYRPTVVATSAGQQKTEPLELRVPANAASADVSLSVAGAEWALAGSTYVYTVTLNNAGPDIAAGLVLSSSFPSPADGLQLLESVSESGERCTAAGASVTCPLTNLGRDGQTAVRLSWAIPAAITSGVELRHQTVIQAANDENLVNNQVARPVTIGSSAGLVLSGSAAPNPVTVGQSLVYSLNLRSSGPSAAGSVSLTGDLPPGLSFSAASPDCRHTLGRVACRWDKLAAGISRTVVITANVTAAAWPTASTTFNASALNSAAPVSLALENTVYDEPISNLNGPAEVFAPLGQATPFTVTASAGSNVSFSWDFGDGSPPASGPTVSHVYGNAGRYTATVTATNHATPALLAQTTLTIPVSIYTNYTWQGVVSSVGEEPLNWLPGTGALPTRSDGATIPGYPAGKRDPQFVQDLDVDVLTIEQGGVLSLLADSNVWVERRFENEGTLRQTRTQLDANQLARFLIVQNRAGDQTHYLGVDVTPQEAQPEITVAVSGQTPCAELTGAAVKRCFEIDGTGSATLIFHYQQAELNGLDPATLLLWRWNPLLHQWQPTGTVTARDTVGPDYSLTAEGVSISGSAADLGLTAEDMSTGARFALRPANTAPTAAADRFTVRPNSAENRLTVSSNDSDPDGDSLTIEQVGQPDKGGKLVNYGTTVGYTPAPDFEGVETFVYTTTDSFGGFAAAQVVVDVKGKGPLTLYLPLVMKGQASGPDLVIDSLSVDETGLTLVIRNQGNAPVKEAFWVDVYVDPSVTPGLNQPWNTIAPAGATWGVTADIPVGGSLTLSRGDSYYFPQYSSDRFPAGAQVYGYVDSVNHLTTYGNVAEGREGNNLFGPETVSAGSSASIAAQNGSPPDLARLPARFNTTWIPDSTTLYLPLILRE